MEHLPIDQIDAHVDDHLAKSEELAAQKMLNLCSIWTGVRPVVKFARALLFWKPKWQQVIDQLITSLDEACGTQQ